MTDFTIAQAIAQMGLSPDDEQAVRCVVRRPKDKGFIHATATDVGGRRVEDITDDLYHTLARYTPGAITASGGRTRANAVSVDMLPFDADLKDYLGLPLDVLHAMPHEELDVRIASLVKDTREVFARVGIPIHRIDCTGYGIALYTRLHHEDQRRLDDAANVLKCLIGRVNRANGAVLVDPSVSDPATRLMRLVGSQNHKGPLPRTVHPLWERDGASRLDDFAVEPAPPRSLARPVEEKALSEDTLDEITLALANEYHEGMRNVIAYALPAMFCKAGVPREQCLEVVGRLAVDDEEQESRLHAVDRTYDKWEAGYSVSGYYTLTSALSPRVRTFVGERLHRFQHSIVIDDIDITEAPLLDTMTPSDHGNAYPPPPAECFSGMAGDYVKIVEGCTAGSDAYHLASWWTLAGQEIGRTAYVYQAARHYPNLMTVLIGDSAVAHKDTCVNLAQDTFDLLDEPNPADGMIPIRRTRLIRGIATEEGLLDNLQEKGTSALIRIPEFNRLLSKARREVGQGVIPLLLILWDGQRSIDLPTRKDALHVVEPFVSLISTITPQILARDMTQADIESGFGNRVLWVFGSGKGWLARPPMPNRDEQQRLMRAFVEARDRVLAQMAGRPHDLTPQAERHFDDWGRAIYEREDFSPEERTLSERLGGNALRIALISAITDGAAVISSKHLDPAMAFMDWQFANVARESQMWGAGDNARLTQYIISTLEEAPMPAPQLFRHLRRHGSMAVRRVVDDLTHMGVIAYIKDTDLMAVVPEHGRRAA